jgi:8-oxo-dGTP pyrophosphatase MutT (NUDIX family)
MNSQLYGNSYNIPQEILANIKTALIQYPTSEGIKRAKNLLNTKSITYQNLKRLKNFFDYYNPQTTSAEQYQLAGGDKMKSWVETVLNAEREGVKQNTETTSDMHVNNRGSKLSNPNPLQKEELDQMGNIMTEGVNLKEDKAIILSDRDLGIFVNAMLNPRKPSENLVKAAENYKKILRENHNEIVNDGINDGVNEGINDGVNEGINDGVNEGIRICAIAIIFNIDHKILLLKRSSETDWCPNKWSFVGGSVDNGETPLEAVEREVREETGLEIKTYIEKFSIKREDLEEHVFVAKYEGNDDDVELNEENTSYIWANQNEFKFLDTVPNFDEYLRKIERNPRSL